MDVLLSPTCTTAARLEILSLQLNAPEETISIVDNKKRFALRLEAFFSSRVPESRLIREGILQDNFIGKKTSKIS